jgi:lipid A 3-O-deacylase
MPPRTLTPSGQAEMKIKNTALLGLIIALWAPGQGQAAQGPFDEAKIGIIAHDLPIGAHRIEDGVDFNGEILFVSPDLLAAIWAPRPHIGVSINSSGGNSYAYAGLTWTVSFLDAFFADLGLGGAVHNGPNLSTDPHHKGLGTRALFHESLELGYRLTPRQSVAAYLDHVSNANTGTRNPGITNLGLRFGLMF